MCTWKTLNYNLTFSISNLVDRRKFGGRADPRGGDLHAREIRDEQQRLQTGCTMREDNPVFAVRGTGRLRNVADV